MKYASVRSCAFLIAATAVALMCMGQPVVVEAQSSRLTANIPFDFYVGHDLLPAGKYDLRTVAGSVLRVLSENGERTAAISTIPVWNESGRVSKLVFNRYGKTYFLSEVHWQGFSQARGLIKSPSELELARSNSRRVVETEIGK
jgi:hypothetical protein